MAVAKLDLRDINWDLDGHLSAGGKVYTYAASTLDPLATYADATGAVANTNPIISDSSGQSHIWLTVGVAYKFVFATPGDVPIYTENGVAIAATGAGGAGSEAYDVAYYFLGGPPSASQEVFRHDFDRAVDFAADFTGSFGSVQVNPTASYVETVKKNGSTVGTIATTTSGAVGFATSAGATVSFAAGDRLTVTAPGTADATAAGFSRTFAGTLG